jgi:hypothetical protein
MSTNYHDPIISGAAANAATFNIPLGQLDAAISAVQGVYAPTSGGISEDRASDADASLAVVWQTTLTLALTGADDIDLPDGGDHGAGLKVYTFPAGRILLLGAVIDAVTAIDGASGDAAIVSLGVGTVEAEDDATLTGTEQNVIPSTAVADGASTWKTALAASAQLDGTSTAVSLYVNAGVTDAVSASAVTVAITGTLKLTWINLGDY